ncbi:MAG TPA: cytochrome P450 [Caldimonas sp.]|jgi:cytochrome P450|nr:cytochrome P450 [Caldimonas sp.]HEX2542853.1 cytochrome P450 [Caldimonas sp.]
MRPAVHSNDTPPDGKPWARRIEDLPGPRGLPVLGNLLQVHSGRIHRDVERWAELYGPLFQFKLGRRRFLAVSDHEELISVLRDRPEGFRRTSRLDEVNKDMGLASGVFASNGEAWRRQRRIVMAAFDPAHVKAYFPMLLRVTERLHRRWQAPASSGGWIDLRADLMRYTVDGVAGLAFGHDVNTVEGGEDVIQKHLDKIFPALFKRLLAPISYWRYVKLPSDRELDRSVSAVNRAVDGFIAAARNRMAADEAASRKPSNLLEAMILEADKEGSGVGDREIAGNVLTMLLAGEDTTANTLSWLIWLLHRNPACMQRCRSEILAAVPDHTLMTPEALACLEYLEACINEAMRLRPVVPSMMNEAVRDTTVGDVLVPAGTVVWLTFRHDTMKEQFFPDPAAFKPDRWLDPDARGLSSAKRVAMPFGGGPRICPGRYLALLEMKMAVVMLLGCFEVEDVRTPDRDEPLEHLTLTMSPIGLRMKLRERLADAVA